MKPALEPISAIDKIPIHECGEALVNLQEYCPRLQVNPTIGLPFVRRGVGDRLNHAQSLLPTGIFLYVHRALRTLKMQKQHWDDYYKELQAAHPTWAHPTLCRQTNKFFAPYTHKAPPGHCTGGAVDVHLVDANGNKLDISSPFSNWDAAPTWRSGLTIVAHTNRMLLLNVMLNAEFSNCKDEYWHYSYGDSAWAVRTGEKHAVYGLLP